MKKYSCLFLDENNEEHTWKAKQTYRFDISQY